MEESFLTVSDEQSMESPTVLQMQLDDNLAAEDLADVFNEACLFAAPYSS